MCLGCMNIRTSDHDPSARAEQVSSVITRRLETMIEAANLGQIFLKRKAISTITPFAVSLERDGQQGTFDITVRAVRSPSPKKLCGTELCPTSIRYSRNQAPLL